MEYTVTVSEIEAILQKLQEAVPSSRVSAKRQLLMNARVSIIALYQRGHSWRSLARELSSATGENISPDLLRTACMKRASRRRTRHGNSDPAAPPATVEHARKATPATSTSASFGARGLKL